MNQVIGLDPDGAPIVRAFRDDERRMSFHYLTIRSGGMAVFVPVADQVLRDIELPRGRVTLEDQRRAVSLALASELHASVTEGDAAAPEAAVASGQEAQDLWRAVANLVEEVKRLREDLGDRVTVQALAAVGERLDELEAAQVPIAPEPKQQRRQGQGPRKAAA